jgi:hypothetical protein
MATYNFVDSAAKGYTQFWDHRETILKMSILPFVVKVVCYILIAALGLTDNYLRQGWVLLPTYFVEGWLAACLIRLVAFDEPWPTRGRMAADEAYLLRRARAVMAGIISYVLIMLALSFFAGNVLATAANVEQIERAPEPTLQTFLIGCALLAGVLWSFRLLWAFIPVTMGVTMKTYLQKAQGFMTSFYMIGTWLLCLIPLIIVATLIEGVLSALFLDDTTDSSKPYQFFFILAQSAIEIVVVAVSTLALTDGIKTILSGEQKKKDDDDGDWF